MNRPKLFFLTLIILTGLFWLGCGKKTPPVLSEGDYHSVILDHDIVKPGFPSLS